MSKILVNVLLRIVFGVVFAMCALSTVNYFEINNNAAIMIVGYWCFSLAEGISDTMSGKMKEKIDE